jgi:putative acid phosphatase of HAD superfamily subfamily IIIB
VAAVLAAAVPGLAVGQAPGSADQIPPPHPILTHIGHTPLIELSDGGAGLPYGARAAIEQQGCRIIASVGDQYSDLAGGHEDKAFKLPNPFYFLP